LSFLLIAAVSSAVLLAAATDYRRSGDDHFYNLEYDQAISDYAELIRQDPADPMTYNDLASAQLYKELHRLGLLDSSALGGDNRFLRDGRPQADPSVKARFFDTLERGRRTAESVRAHDPGSVMALYSLCTNSALRANYEFMLEKAWLVALRNGSEARKYCDQARKLAPEFIDSYLVLGAYEYATGSLPLPFKLLASIGGIHGSKKKGIDYVARVAREGKYERIGARVLLSVLYRREKRPLEAAQVLETLAGEYPRNYLFGLELAATYSDARETGRALGVLKNLLQRADQNAAGYRQLPREAVQRKIKVLDARLAERRAAPDSKKLGTRLDNLCGSGNLGEKALTPPGPGCLERGRIDGMQTPARNGQ